MKNVSKIVGLMAFVFFLTALTIKLASSFLATWGFCLLQLVHS